MRIGAFVCDYSGNISNCIDTGKVAKEAETLDDVPLVDNQAHLCEELLKDTGIVILPGASFERPKELPSGFLETWRSGTLEGARRIAQWAFRGN
ncbi:MAG: hypothetical protein KAW39_04225 [Thermoplasmata archaeon]|nr:hypothetical protein [Thermoplasmata archaeon]